MLILPDIGDHVVTAWRHQRITAVYFKHFSPYYRPKRVTYTPSNITFHAQLPTAQIY